jgi:hypothetical protein
MEKPMTDAPAKRGPGRPRKPVAPEPAVEAAVEAAADAIAELLTEPEHAPKHARPEPKKHVIVPDGLDGTRLGQFVDKTTTQVGYDDGRVYLAEDGVVVERIA